MTRLRIAMAVPGLPFGPDTLETASLGGSETAGLYMAVELAALGHDVHLFCNGDARGKHRGVWWYPLEAFQHFAIMTPHDVTIVQRAPDLFAHPYASRLNVLWQHDMAMARNAGQFRGVMWNVDMVTALSAYHRDQYTETYGLAEPLLWQTRNGLDPDAFLHIDVVKRDRKLLVYASRPERGLDVLLERIMPRLLARDPALRLSVVGYDNQVDHMAGFYQHCRHLADALGGAVDFAGHLPKSELYTLYASAGVLVYPTPSPILRDFREISCITAMEAMAAGLPMVTSRAGALPETLDANAGTLIDGDPSTDDYADAFCDAVMRFVEDGESHKKASRAGRRAAGELSWSGVAQDWSREFTARIEATNHDPVRLAHHFIRRSDIVAARHLLDGVGGGQAQACRDRIEADWSFANSDHAYAEQYAKIGATHTDAWAAGSQEARLAQLIHWLGERKELANIVDVGCGMGIYAINISNALVDRTVTGLDIDPKTIEWAERYRTEYATNPDRLVFNTGREYEAVGEGFDCALACEVAEHVPEPWTFLADVEAKVRPGGKVYVTVPYGPWEHISYETYPHRCHLWEFEPNDFYDMLGDKPDLAIDSMFAGCVNPITQEPLGWYIVTWTADHAPIGGIDMERKCRFQRPRETVSASLMVGGAQAEDTLRWCLAGIKPHADEIVVADNGMTDVARQVAAAFGCRIVPGADPNEHGFEAGRNLSLNACTGDWVLWIDSDERLMNGPSMNKYLRANMYDGYSIKQHHLALDTHFDPDMPVRLFRRERADGKSVRFYGMIHEHPETALNEGPGEILILPDVHIAHLGYLTEPVRQQRFLRNSPLLARDREIYPDRILQKHFVMRDNILLIGHLISRDGMLTGEIEHLAREVVDLYREYFLGKSKYAHVDAMQYYTEALRVLGEGVEVSFDLQASRDGIGDTLNGHGQRMRFASVEEARVEIAHRLEKKLQPLMRPGW